MTADLTRLALQARRKEGHFDTGLFLESFVRELGPEGTLAIAAYNFNLRDKDHYSRSRTIPITGALALEALKRGDFIRTSHPLHSFLVSGKHAGEISELSNFSSFGPDSPFAFFRQENARMLMAGTGISEAFTFVHFVEETAGVGYRKMKEIEIFLEDEQRWARYGLFAKKRGWTMALEGLEKLLLERSAARQWEFGKVPFSMADLAGAYDVIYDDLQYNHARNIARFSRGLYIRESLKKAAGMAGIFTTSDKIGHDPGLL